MFKKGDRVKVKTHNKEWFRIHNSCGQAHSMNELIGESGVIAHEFVNSRGEQVVIILFDRSPSIPFWNWSSNCIDYEYVTGNITPLSKTMNEIYEKVKKETSVS